LFHPTATELGGVIWVEVGTEGTSTDDVETWELLGLENGFQVCVRGYLFHYFFVYVQVNMVFRNCSNINPDNTTEAENMVCATYLTFNR
jgi:D-lyxose ketol-isomerase